MYAMQARTHHQEQQPKSTVTVAPVLEALSLSEVKKHIVISSTDDSHDGHLYQLMQAAREQWEDDTDSSAITQTRTIKLQSFPDCIELPRRPIQSVSSIQYYDGGNASQTLSTSVYALDAEWRKLRLKYQQYWPYTVDRWDAITVTYVAGYAAAYDVPRIARQAMLLLVGYYFENRDLHANEIVYNREAYEALVRRYMRSTYP